MALPPNKFSGALQENILTLLCFDSEACPIIIAAVDTSLFESGVYRTIADRSIAYFRKYKKAPADHLPDLIEDFLSSKKKSQVRMYTEALHDLRDLSDGINRKFVLDEIAKFVRQQSLRQSITIAAEELQQGNLDTAERHLLEGLKKRIIVFEKGMTVTEAIASPSLYDPQKDLIRTGIQPFDDDGVCPAPGELYTVMALAKRGKTWWMQSIGKYAAMQRKNVLHISLEMSEEKIARRYVQSFFAMTRRPEIFSVPIIKRDDRDRFLSLSSKRMRKRPSLLEPSSKKRVKGRAKRFGKKFDRILIKQFPTNQLTTDGLYAYLEMLEQEESFHPDLVIIDYADLMKLDINNIRVDTGRVYKDLRGLAVDQNIAVVTASQSNRSGEDSRLLTMKNFAEDYSKAGISDNIVTYNQTPQEKELGLARLFSVAARDEKSGQTVLITQSYSSGQFALDAVRLTSAKTYWEEIDSKRR
jgi:replicative DNA helicase